jgi:hypothetical protein
LRVSRVSPKSASPSLFRPVRRWRRNVIKFAEHTIGHEPDWKVGKTPISLEIPAPIEPGSSLECSRLQCVECGTFPPLPRAPEKRHSSRPKLPNSGIQIRQKLSREKSAIYGDFFAINRMLDRKVGRTRKAHSGPFSGRLRFERCGERQSVFSPDPVALPSQKRAVEKQ